MSGASVGTPTAANGGRAPDAAGGPGSVSADLRMDAELTRKLLGHGPWPVAPARDRSNRVAGQTAAIEFGYRMFREPRMSPSGYIACISCHQTDRAFTDGIARAQGLAPVGRNSPTLANLRLLHWYGWDGGSDSLWMASLRPMLDAREIGSDAARVAHVVRVGDGLACRYRHSFGAPPTAHRDELVMVNVAKAIAAFAGSLTTQRTAFDHFRDALARGDERAARAYPAAAQRGALLFVGKARCASCHAGPAFSDGGFHHLDWGRGGGAAASRAWAPAGRGDDAGAAADPGREAGLAFWRQSPYNRFSRHSDHPLRRTAADRSDIGDTALRGAFRTPPLRNVAVTAPYLHDGSAATLFDAVAHVASGGLPAQAAGGAAGVLHEPLSVSDRHDLVAFLHTLTDAQAAVRSFPSRPPSPCPAAGSP